jgi:lipoprotein-releasing system permease protein
LYRVFLSLRFLRHHWLMTLIGSFFVGASLVVLVVVMAVMDGFQERLRETVSGASADLWLTPAYPADLAALERVAMELAPQVVAGAPFYETLTIVRRAGRVDALDERVQPVEVHGVDGRKEQQVNKFGEFLRLRPPRLPRHVLGGANGGPAPVHQGSADDRPYTVRDPSRPFFVHDEFERAAGTMGVVLGVGLAERLGVRPNQKMRMMSVRLGPDAGPGDGTPDVDVEEQFFLVVGLYQSGNSEIDQARLFMDHEDFTRFFSPEVYRASVRLRLEHADKFDEVLELLKVHSQELMDRSVAPGVTLSRDQMAIRPASWKDKNRSLVQAIESEKSMILVIAFLIVVAGTSSIFAAQWLLVTDKVREIGILRALGASVDGVMSIFVLNGFLMGLFGAVGGTALGLLVVREIDSVHELVSRVTGRDPFNPEIYFFDRIPTLVDYHEVAVYAGAALVCTLVASAVPALRAGLMDPAKALHRD